MTKSSARIAREQEARQIVERRKRLYGPVGTVVGYIISGLVGIVLGTFVAQPFLAWIKNPGASVIVRGFRQDACTLYLVGLDHKRSLDSASFYLRFPGTIEDVRIGVAENIAETEQDFERKVDGMFDSRNGRCKLVSPKPLDSISVTSTFTGNTFSAHVSSLINNVPVQAVIITMTNESSIYPAPKKLTISGEYSFNSFGSSATKPIPLVDFGVMPPAKKQNF